MWGDELEMIFKTMANMKPKSYFEWGAGGSTRWFSAFASELVKFNGYFRLSLTEVTGCVSRQFRTVVPEGSHFKTAGSRRQKLEMQ